MHSDGTFYTTWCDRHEILLKGRAVKTKDQWFTALISVGHCSGKYLDFLSTRPGSKFLTFVMKCFVCASKEQRVR